MTKEYKASLQLNNELSVVFFETTGNPIEYLWAHYGISTYIEYIEEVVKDSQEPEAVVEPLVVETKETDVEAEPEEDVE